MKLKQVTTTKAHLWWAMGIVLGAVAKTLFEEFPYWEFGGFWTLGFLGVGTKRLMQKHRKFNNGEGDV